MYYLEKKLTCLDNVLGGGGGFRVVLEKHYYFTLSYKDIYKGILTLYLKKVMNDERFLYCFRIDIAVVGAYLWEIMYS